MSRRVLIVGGDSLVGAHLAGVLRDAGMATGVTSRRPGGDRFLDLGADIPADVTEGWDTVVIAAAITGRAACDAAPEAAHRVNVAAPLALAAPVLARGGHAVFLSTHIVLGGARPFLPADAPHAPCDTYSFQKAEAEQRLAALSGGRLTIVRLTKVLDPASGVLANWAAAMAGGDPIDVYTDLVMAPVGLDHVSAGLANVVQTGQGGTVHLSGSDEISFADLARRLGERLGWPPHLIRAQEGRPLNPIAARTPPHASLATPDPQPLEGLIGTLVRRMG